MKYNLLPLALVFGLSAYSVIAQDVVSGQHNVAINVPEIAILDIESTDAPNISFALDASGVEAGDQFIIDEENSDLWINYTSLVIGPSNEKNITITGEVPGVVGLVISVVASPHTGSGGGDFGTPTSVVVPSTTPTNIITGIGSAYTGDGNTNGHNLTYYLDFNGNFEDLNSNDATSTISMTYTITD